MKYEYMVTRIRYFDPKNKERLLSRPLAKSWKARRVMKSRKKLVVSGLLENLSVSELVNSLKDEKVLSEKVVWTNVVAERVSTKPWTIHLSIHPQGRKPYLSRIIQRIPKKN